jgi:hypothetical protein
MSLSDFSGRLLEPTTGRARRPLSIRASTASCSSRFSWLMIDSGAWISMIFFRRLLRLMMRRYRSLRSEVAKRPPSSWTIGRSSGEMTGTTSRIIHSGRLRLMSASYDLEALDRTGAALALGDDDLLAQLAGELAPGRLRPRSSLIASAPMLARTSARRSRFMRDPTLSSSLTTAR